MLREGDTLSISLKESVNDLYAQTKTEETEETSKKEFKTLTIKDYKTKNVEVILHFFSNLLE